MRRSGQAALSLAALAIALLFCRAAWAQQTVPPGSDERDRGIQLYQTGDSAGAIEALRDAVQKNKSDSAAWHYLGLALVNEGKKEDARRAFEKAAIIRLHSLGGIPPGDNSQALSQPWKRAAESYQLAIESVEQYLKITPAATDDWKSQLDALRFFHDYLSGLRHDEIILPTREATTKVRILSKPEPDFSRTRASGNCVLRAVFISSGRVDYVTVVRPVEPQFDLACIEAAKRIKFAPAVKDGNPVATILLIEYNRAFY
jgi:tetratricopeptide (TPR) repeat protein